MSFDIPSFELCDDTDYDEDDDDDTKRMMMND